MKIIKDTRKKEDRINCVHEWGVVNLEQTKSWKIVGRECSKCKSIVETIEAI